MEFLDVCYISVIIAMMVWVVVILGIDVFSKKRHDSKDAQDEDGKQRMNVRNGIVYCVALAMIVWTLISEHPDTGVLRILAAANTVFIALICGMLTYKNFCGAVRSFRDNDIKGVLVSFMLCLTAVGAGVYFIAVR